MQNLEKDKQEARKILEKYNRRMGQGILPTPQSQEQKKDDEKEKKCQEQVTEVVCHPTPPAGPKDKGEKTSQIVERPTKVEPYRHPHYQEAQRNKTYQARHSSTTNTRQAHYSSLRFQHYRYPEYIRGCSGCIKINLGWIDPHSMRNFSNDLRRSYRLDINNRRWSHASLNQDASRAKHFRGEGML